MILWPGAAILWALPAAPWAGTASMWAGTAALEAARTDSRCSQTLPGTPRSSQELPEAARSWKKRFLAGFRGQFGGGCRRTGKASWALPRPKAHFSKITIPYKPGQAKLIGQTREGPATPARQGAVADFLLACAWWGGVNQISAPSSSLATIVG